LSDLEVERGRLIAEAEALLGSLPDLPPSQLGYEKFPYMRAHGYWTRIANLVKDAAEWLSIHAGQPTAFASKPWLLLQLSGDTRAARGWPISDVERDLKFVRATLAACGGKNSSAPDATPIHGLASSPTVWRVPRSDQDRIARAARRQLVVMPILQKKHWSRAKWATQAGVGKNCVYEYLEGRRTLRTKNSVALAEELGLPPQDLPE